MKIQTRDGSKLLIMNEILNRNWHGNEEEEKRSKHTSTTYDSLIVYQGFSGKN